MALGEGRIAHAVLDRPRTARVERSTRETRIEIEVDLDGIRHRLDSDEALAAHGAGEVRLLSGEGGQAVLLGGMPLREPFVQKGPFAMSDANQLAAVIAAHAAGELVTVD